MTRPGKPVPRKLSRVIELAIADARKLDRRRYRPWWTRWHEPAASGECTICLAGAVIAGTLGCPINMPIDMDEQTAFSNERWRWALLALDRARTGEWELALHTLKNANRMRGVPNAELRGIPVPDAIRFHDWESFDRHLASLADRARQLRAIGL